MVQWLHSSATSPRGSLMRAPFTICSLDTFLSFPSSRKAISPLLRQRYSCLGGLGDLGRLGGLGRQIILWDIIARRPISSLGRFGRLARLELRRIQRRLGRYD